MTIFTSNQLTYIFLILKTSLEGSQVSAVPPRGGGHACVTWPGDFVSPLVAFWRLEHGGAGGAGVEMYVSQKEEQLLNIHSCVRHAFFFT